MGFLSFVAVVAYFSLNWFVLLLIIKLSKKGIDGLENAVNAIVYLFIRPFSFGIVLNMIVFCILGNTYVSKVIMDICNTSKANLMVISGLGLFISSIIVYLLSRVAILKEEIWPLW